MIRCWIGDEKSVRAAEPAEAVAAIPGGANVWTDFDCEDDASVRRTLEPLQIHPLVIEDIVSDVNRPKVDNFGDYLYLVVHSARWDEDKPHLREIDMVLGQRFLITSHDGTTRSVVAAHDVLPRRHE